MALSQIMTARTESTTIVLAKFGKSPQGSFAIYQLSMNEDNFKVFCDISTVNRSDSDNHVNDSQLTAFPRFPLMLHINSFKYQLSGGGGERENRDINTTYHMPFCLKVKFSFQVHLSTKQEKKHCKRKTELFSPLDLLKKRSPKRVALIINI